MSNQQQALQFKTKGNEAFKAKKWTEAIQLFTKAIQCNPNDHVFFSNRSGSYLNNGQYQQALQDAQACIKIKPEWARGYQRKGTAQYYLEQHQEAIKTYQEGLKYDPNNAELQKNLKEVEGKKKQQPDNNAMMQLYMKLLSDPQTQGLMSDPTFLPLLQSIMSNPMEAMKHMNDPRVQKIMQVLQKNTPKEDLQKAAQSFASKTGAQMPTDIPKPEFNTSEAPKKEESYSAPPPPPPPKKEAPKPQKMDVEDPAEQAKAKGNDLFKKKQFNDALNYYEEAIQLNPNEPLYYNNKAAAYIELNELDSALEEINRAEKLFEEGVVKDFVKKAKVLARKGNIYAKQNNYDEAISAYQKSLMEDTNYNVKDQMIQVKKLKKEKEAKDYINPELGEKHNEEGASLYKEGKYPAALKEYEEATRRDPDCAKYYSNIGQVYIKLMEFQRAKENYQIALKKDPTFQKAYHKKGDCHFFMKQYHKALETYEAGLKRDPTDNFCKEGAQKTQAAIYMGSNQEDQEERAKKAMADPEIQTILQTPEVRNALSELQKDPKALNKILSNRSLAQKIEKLIAAGVLKMG